jgi:hypothetical protein
MKKNSDLGNGSLNQPSITPKVGTGPNINFKDSVPIHTFESAPKAPATPSASPPKFEAVPKNPPKKD